MFRLIKFNFVFSILIFSVSVTLACGGFFPGDGDILQSEERMIMTVNGDGTYTAILGISYQGEADEFSRLLPVPSVPEVEVVDQGTWTYALLTDPED